MQNVIVMLLEHHTGIPKILSVTRRGRGKGSEGSYEI